jgi:hypothetical protein
MNEKVTWFAGWARPNRRHKWKLVITAESEDAAWRALHAYAERLEARSVDLTLTRAGVDPNATPRPR